MHAEPITCYRPRPEAAAEFASLPYDVYTRAEAAAYVSCHPRSFLAIDRPETSFSPVHDMYADDVYEKAHELLAARVTDGTLQRDGNRCYYLYRLRANGHEQTGIVAACSIDDYTNGIIRRHELTRPEKVDDRARHIDALRRRVERPAPQGYEVRWQHDSLLVPPGRRRRQLTRARLLAGKQGGE